MKRVRKEQKTQGVEAEQVQGPFGLNGPNVCVVAEGGWSLTLFFTNFLFVLSLAILPTVGVFGGRHERIGIKCLVLESWDDLRVTGYAYTAWTNAWKALDVLGVGDSLRQNHQKIDSIVASSSILGLPTSQIFYHNVIGKHGDHELRCVRRKDLLEALANELPQGTIRFGAKVVSIVEAKYLKLVHLADGTVLKAKMLIGCDGVNSIVAKSLGHGNPSFLGRSAIRGYTKYPNGHSFEPKFMQFTGDGFRSGFVPCDETTMHWYFTFSPSTQYKDAGVEHDPKAMKQFVLQNLGKVPEKILNVVEQTSVNSISTAQLRFRWPLDVLWPGAICSGNVCVAGDALHAMTPDIGQGGCAALEDAIVLARCVGQVFLQKDTEEKGGVEDEYSRIENGMKKFADERRWRSFELMVTSYVVCMIQGSSWKVIGFVRDRILSRILSGTLVNMADFDCGKLTVS